MDITYSIRIDEGRDNGQTSSSTNTLKVSENERVITDYNTDDGYGNYRYEVSTITKFIIKVNGIEIYNSTSEPQNGGVYNGYRLTYTKQTEQV